MPPDFRAISALQIKYTGFRDRPHEERQTRFQNACRDGRSEIVSRRAWGRGEAAGGPRRAPLTCCARPGRVPDGAADAAAPGTERAQAHFLVRIRKAKKPTPTARPALGRARVPSLWPAALVSALGLELKPEPGKRHRLACDLDGDRSVCRKNTPVHEKNHLGSAIVCF